ncbi:hypothetical protein C8R43DRAFT_357934 [Mycena crocata]|nr:hypothetical protein C8R43DRAFT_357934 [Mycena crocata]
MANCGHVNLNIDRLTEAYRCTVTRDDVGAPGIVRLLSAGLIFDSVLARTRDRKLIGSSRKTLTYGGLDDSYRAIYGTRAPPGVEAEAVSAGDGAGISDCYLSHPSSSDVWRMAEYSYSRPSIYWVPPHYSTTIMPFHKTFDAYVPSNNQQFFALAKLKPDFVAFDTLRAVPLDPEHKASFEYSKKITPPSGFVHTVRCYYFALAMLHNGFPSGTPGVPQITFEELNRRLYHTCLLHDLGWSHGAEARAHPEHGMTFELHGGIMAYEHLQTAAPALDAQQVGDIVQSIVLHTSQWPEGTSSATAMLLSLSAIFDVGGYDAMGPGSLGFLISRKTVQEVEKVYPRGTFAPDGFGVMNKEFDEKPNCLLSHFPGGREGFLKVVRVEPLVPAEE